jgi:DHA2 family multidrug resistance protein
MENRPLSPLALTFLNIALAVATLLIVLDYSIANVSIPYIAGDLAVSSDQGTYVITAFAVGNGIVLAISGWLTKRLGAIRLLLLSMLLFVLFSWICGIAWSFEILVAGRFLQGVVAGPLIPLSQTLLITHNPPEKRNKVMAFWSMVVITGPVIGPVIGGWITFNYQWPWIFFINIPIGLLAALVIWALTGKSQEKTEKVPLEWFGLLLLTVGVSCLQVFLDKGQQWDWFRSPTIRVLSITALLSLSFLIIWEATHPKPLLDLRLAKIKSFAVSLICIAVAYAMYFGSVVLIPLWLQTNMGYTAYLAGLAVAPIGLVPVFTSALAAKAVDRFGKILPLCFAFIFFAISCFYTAFFTTDVDIYHVGFSRFLLGFGFVLFLTPLLSLSVQDIPQEKLANAASIFHFVRAIFGGIGTSIFTTMWLRRTYYHHNTLGSAITAYTDNSSDFFHNVNEAGISGSQALDLLNNAVDNQAALLAQNDCFWVMAWAFLALIPFLFFAKGRKKSQVIVDAS